MNVSKSWALHLVPGAFGAKPFAIYRSCQHHRRTRPLDELIRTSDDLTALREKVFPLEQSA